LRGERANNTFTFMGKVKRINGATTRISSKHQITIPVSTLREAGLEVGERLSARCDGVGRVVLQREADVLAEFAGALTGVYEKGELDALRNEWK